jgi:uncharacterized protein with ParB-like and HNH nuclease domain
MATPTDSINSFVNKLQSVDEGYVLPAIQRPYVWKEKQIAKLFDSILRNFPLGNLMIWRTKKDLSSRSFRKDWKSGEYFNLLKEIPVKTKNVVLDGQQRLQSLLIGMRGTFNGKSLYFNLLSNPLLEDKIVQGDMAYEFKFFAKQPADRKWISVRELSQAKIPSVNKFAKSIIREEDKGLSDSIDLIVENIETFRNRTGDLSYLGYISIDETGDDLNLKSDEDIVEIFVRSNNGGTKLDKSDLLFSLLSSKWEPAYEKIRLLESRLSQAGFDFSRDYILKATLMCIGEGAAYNVAKFKKLDVLNKVEKNWDSIANAFEDVISFLQSRTPITSRKSLVSANSLLPLIAMRKGMTIQQWNNFDQDQACEYILRTSLARSFNAGKDDLLDKLQQSMESGFDLNKILGILKSANRSVDFNTQKIWAITYNDRAQVYFALSKVVSGLNLNQISATAIDHIIPKALLLKERDPKDVNQLANLTILSDSDNKSKGKKLLSDWLSEMEPGLLLSFCTRHSIPTEKSLWLPGNFDQFISERKKLIANNTPLGELFQKEESTSDDEDEDEINGG